MYVDKQKESQYHMGINMSHDRSAALVKNGEIVVAIEQERLDRYKHSVGMMLQAPEDSSQIQIPFSSIRYCLEAADITMVEVSTITANMPGHDLAPGILLKHYPEEIEGKVKRISSHHLAHAYSAYWPSGFDNAIILVVDASGSIDSNNLMESYTIYEGRGNTITCLHKEKVPVHLASLSTLGFVYEYITRKAGFVTKVGESKSLPEAGKLMGLASYGQRQKSLHKWMKVLKDSYSIKLSAYDIFLEVASLEKKYRKTHNKQYMNPFLVDLACKVQEELEEALLHIVELAIRKTGLRKLCFAGGVALNSVANYRLLSKFGLDDIFIFPAAGDSGIAAGCALWAYHTIEGGQTRKKLRKATLGKSYTMNEIKKALFKHISDVEVKKVTESEMIEYSAKAISKGSIVARFEGGSEYGPRALGHRSIIVDPTYKRMKDIINARVKFREPFRPFAPVVPLEKVSQIFEIDVESPFMLLVPPVKREYRDQIPAVLHVDGTGRVQTVTKEHNPYFYTLCHRLSKLRKGPPVLLNTSFNIAGKPIVETPDEAVQTFLSTDIDYLLIENFWVSKKNIPVLRYNEHLIKITDTKLPEGLPSDEPGVTDLMEKLDQALFFEKGEDSPWLQEELTELSSKGGLLKETSNLFSSTPFYDSFTTQLSSNVVLLINPMGESKIVDLSMKIQPFSYTFDEVKLLLAIINSHPNKWWDQMRIDFCSSNPEFKQHFLKVIKELDKYGLKPKYSNCFRILNQKRKDTPIKFTSIKTLAPFEDENYSAKKFFHHFHNLLSQTGYTDENICNLLGLDLLQQIEPTHLHYYNKHLLPTTILGDLIRLFLLRASLSEERISKIFRQEILNMLVVLGILNHRSKGWSSSIDLFCLEGMYIATDHRYMVYDEDKIINETPVMYVGMDSVGLIHSAPRYVSDRVLDLCCGSGIQGLSASRYAKEVIGVDVSNRAIRFARFNAQLNDIDNIRFLQGNLYNPVKGEVFDTILANPPFVPSPERNISYRDGGNGGEEILRRIIMESTDYLSPGGRLFIVSDLCNSSSYIEKLKKWWREGHSQILILKTADRNDILFSVPHCHAPFGQDFEDYNNKLEKWLCNFHNAGLNTVNFGYILIVCDSEIKKNSYYSRNIYNPTIPIHEHVKKYFQQRKLMENTQQDKIKYLSCTERLCFRIETSHNSHSDLRKIEIFSPDNPYFTTYRVSEKMYQILYDIHNCKRKIEDVVTPYNKEHIYDLIYKGILNINSKEPNFKQNKKQRSQENNRGLELQEMQTKTTPTCLSSYLK